MAHKIVQWNSLSHMRNLWPRWTFRTHSVCARYLRWSDCTIGALRCQDIDRTQFFLVFIFLFMARNFQMNDYANYASQPIPNGVHFHHFVSLLLSTGGYQVGTALMCAAAMAMRTESERKNWKGFLVVVVLCGSKFTYYYDIFFFSFCGDS